MRNVRRYAAEDYFAAAPLTEQDKAQLAVGLRTLN
jgi:hypothetical protein